MISIRSTEGLNLLTSYPLKYSGTPHGNSDKLEVVVVVEVVVEVLIEIVVVVVAEVVKVEIVIEKVVAVLAVVVIVTCCLITYNDIYRTHISLH